VGLYGCPTTVNNVESSRLPTILRRGAVLVRRLRPPNNTGTKLFCISGHVNKPCTVEEAMSIPFRELIETHCGGIRGGWDNLKAVIPGGSSVPLRAGRQIMRRADGFRLPARRAQVGPRHGGGDRDGQDTDIIKAIWRLSKFYKHESCGQCTPCREGTGWMMRVMERMVKGECGEVEEIDMLFRCDQAGRRPHHLRARRRSGLADPGPDPAFPRRDRRPHQRVRLPVPVRAGSVAAE
jgi:NADH-quinone oxidoreductase subunit F